MKTSEYIEILGRDGALLAAAAERAGTTAAVPGCPGWRVRDLILHTGSVHRWASGFVTGAIATPQPIPEVPPAALVTDAALIAWFREGHARLVDALTVAAPGLDCWHFLPAPSALEFWARRQAHETAVHRHDSETAAGAEVTPFSAEFAADGVDEILTGFHGRDKSRVRSVTPRTLRLVALDAGDEWLARISAAPLAVDRGAGAAGADCTVRGTAAQLYLALWNRAPLSALDVSGDVSVAGLWQRTSAVT